MSTARLITTTGIAWLTSLALTVVVLLGIHRVLSQDEACALAAGRHTNGAFASAAPHLPRRLSQR
jgi:hypothetical protein